MQNHSEELAKVLHYYGLSDGMSGDTFKIVCPLHGDVNPSMLIDLKKGEWYCFGCSRGGRASDFVIELEKKYGNLTELQAGFKYARILHSNKTKSIKINNLDQQQKKKNRRKNGLILRITTTMDCQKQIGSGRRTQKKCNA